MTETEIKQMLVQGERLTLECKKAKTELPKSVWESYSAFANTIGGYILLGIDENRKETDIAKHFTIIGVDIRLTVNGSAFIPCIIQKKQ